MALAGLVASLLSAHNSNDRDRVSKTVPPLKPQSGQADMRLNRDLATSGQSVRRAGRALAEGRFRCVTVFQHVSNLASETLLRERFLQQGRGAGERGGFSPPARGSLRCGGLAYPNSGIAMDSIGS